MDKYRKLKDLSQRVMNPSPILAGTVNKQSITCGNSNCRCMDKKNPQKHSCHKLSYSQNGKTKTITLKKADIEVAAEMTESYRELRKTVLEFGHESAALVRSHGATKAREVIAEVLQETARISAGGKPESGKLRDARASRDKWKKKAKERHRELEKNKVRIRDLSASRENWKTKSMTFRRQIKVLEEKIDKFEKERLKTDKQPDIKKNRNPANKQP